MTAESTTLSRRPRADADVRLARTTTSSARSTAIRSAAAKGAKLVCLPELFRSRYFCQSENAAHFALAEAVPGPTHETARAARRRTRHHAGREPVRRTRAPGLYHNTAVVLDAGGRLPRQISQDAHPRRSAVLREVLLHAGRSRLQIVRDARGQRRRARVLGSVVSGSRAPHRARGRPDPVLSHRDRLASGRTQAT